MQSSIRSNTSINYSSLTYRPKTDRNTTMPSSHIISQLATTSRYNPETPSHPYIDIAISKRKISFGRGYNDMKQKNKVHTEASDETKRNLQQSKVIVFRNLQQFQVNIKSQRGKLEKQQNNLKAYGLATYKGSNKSVNSHQIGVHIGQLSSFSLLQGYDGFLSATTLKKLYSAKLLEYFRKKKSSLREDTFQTAQQSIRYAIDKSQQQLKTIQQEKGDNSGTSLLSVVIHQNIIFAANCGSSSIYCLTIGGQFLSLSNKHTTDNKAEVDRIVKQGGRLFQTVVNIPFKQQMKVQGPLRVYPSGLNLTRTLGKSLSSSKHQNRSIAEQKGVIATPQIQFIPSSQVRWMIIISSKIPELVASRRIKDIAEQQLAKRSAVYENSQAAQHICKRVLLQAVEGGASQSLSALLLIFNTQQHITLQNPKTQKISIQDQQTATQKKELHKPKSLKYIGKRTNFVEYEQN